MASFREVRAEVLNLSTNKFIDKEKKMLLVFPSEEKIDQVVMGFPKGKSLGGDRVTYDFSMVVGPLLVFVVSKLLLPFGMMLIY